MINRIKNKNAITLLALIITVIILLILATVSISLIINSGILDHTQQGVDKYSEEEELEQIKLAVASAMLKGNGFLETENLNAELQDRFQKGAEQIGNSKRWSLKLDKNYRIYEDGNVEEKESILPAEYQQVEYIESTGTQYIDTKINVNENIGVKVKFKLINELTTVVGIIGSNFNSNNRFSVNPEYSGGKRHINMGWMGSNNKYYIDDFINTIYECENNFYHSRKAYINGTLTSEFVEQQVQHPWSLLMFAIRWNSNNPAYHSKAKIYHCVISRDENIIKNFIPCYSTTTVTNADGVQVPVNTKGMYDLVEGKFYTNQGSGDDFVAGPEV